MKFAPISLVLLLLSVLIFGCKSENKPPQDPVPQQEVVTPPTQDRGNEDSLRSKPKSLPKEQKSDRSLKKKKPKSALDTLRPKTA